MGKEILFKILTQEDIVSSVRKNQEVLLSIIPEIRNMIGFEQNHPHHHLDVWEHTLLALSYSENDFNTRLVLLLHDIGKPHSYQDDEIRHFKGHPKVSKTISQEILKRLNFTEEEINKLCCLIEEHDTPISTKDIERDINLAIQRFKIQYCDALAHNPEKLKKRIEYLLMISEKLNVQLTTEQNELLLKYKCFDKQ